MMNKQPCDCSPGFCLTTALSPLPHRFHNGDLHVGERTSELNLKKLFNLRTMASPSDNGIKIIAHLTVSLFSVYQNIVNSKHCFQLRKDRSISSSIATRSKIFR